MVVDSEKLRLCMGCSVLNVVVDEQISKEGIRLLFVCGLYGDLYFTCTCMAWPAMHVIVSKWSS